MNISPSAYALMGLTAIVACLVAILTFAVLRMISAVRDSRRSRSTGLETALLSAALQEAVAKLKTQERAMPARAALVRRHRRVPEERRADRSPRGCSVRGRAGRPPRRDRVAAVRRPGAA